jgi:hypothetical protein
MGHIWPLFELFGDATKKDMDIVRDYLEPIVEEALVKHREEKEGESKGVIQHTDDEKDAASGERETLLGHLVKETTDKTLIMDETLNILLAGVLNSSRYTALVHYTNDV